MSISNSQHKNIILNFKTYEFVIFLHHHFSLYCIEPTAEDNSSDEVSDKEGTNESEVDNTKEKEEETTPAAEATSEQPKGIGGNLSF